MDVGRNTNPIMKLIYCLIFCLTALTVHGQNSRYKDLPPAIKQKADSDSVFIEIVFNETAPVAAILYFTVDKAGNSSAELYTYTHRYRSSKLTTQKYTILKADSLLERLIRNEQEVLTKADSIEGYKLDWLDGSNWSITIDDTAGSRKYNYPQVYEQPENEDVKRVQQMFSYLDSLYSIEYKRRNMKLRSGKYHNFGEAIMKIK